MYGCIAIFIIVTILGWRKNMSNDFFLKKVKLLVQMHSEGLLGGEVMPEDVLIGIVPTHDLPNVLVHYRVALQPNRHPEIWKRVATGLTHSSSNGDVMGLIESVQFDISLLKNIMQKTRKSEFPYLSGPKIFNYWLYVMESYTEIEWKSRELITVAPDTHILKATVKLGLCSEAVLNGTADSRQTVAHAWERALSGSGIAPIDIHTPLWLWSRAGFPELVISN
ncbi:hypothetical protein COK19_17245 [Bacillus cereus]|nr:hypothetical protein COK19_17245 [Bacillus cereus]